MDYIQLYSRATASLKNATGKDDPTRPMASLLTKPHFLHLALNTTEC